MLPALTTLAVLVAVGALAAGGWWLFAGGTVHPQARYLPDQCNVFLSLKWPDLVQSGFGPTADEMCGLGLVERCSKFLENAGLQPADVERINAGQAADGSGLVLVYRLTRPVLPEEIMERPRFSQARFEQGEVRGTPIYTHVLTDRAIAFPEEQVIVNGEAALVQAALERRGRGYRGPASRLLESLDFSAMCVRLTVGVPPSLREAHLGQCAHLADSVHGTTDCFEYGPEIELVRVLHLDSGRAAGELQQGLQSSVAAAVQDPSAPGAVRQTLAAAKVSAAENTVLIRVTLDASQLSQYSRDSLSRLF
jgi:hypothetical protein